jgi:hypothetical protein
MQAIDRCRSIKIGVIATSTRKRRYVSKTSDVVKHLVGLDRLSETQTA